MLMFFPCMSPFPMAYAYAYCVRSCVMVMVGLWVCWSRVSVMVRMVRS